MDITVVSLLCLLLVSLTSATPTGTKCPPAPGRTESCVCMTAGGIIDLTPLSNTNGIPRFSNMTDPNEYSYNYNPCKPFNYKEYTNIHVYQDVSTFDPGEGYDIADGGTEQMWIDTDGSPYVHYTGPDHREVKVYLTCDLSAKAPIATTTGDAKVILFYEIFIRSCQVCPGGCKDSPPTPLPNNIPVLCPPIPGEPSCVCQHPDGVINLTPYANVSGKATFSVRDENSITHYYNPCQAFHTHKCWNTHICTEGSNSTTLAVGNAGSEKIYIDSGSGGVFVQYTGPAEIPSRVNLLCDRSIYRDAPSFGVEQSSTCSLISELTLKSCQVCPGGCD